MSLTQHPISTMKNSLNTTRYPNSKLEAIDILCHLFIEYFHRNLGYHTPPNVPALIGSTPPLEINNNIKGTEAKNSTKIIQNLPPNHMLTTKVIAHKIYLATLEPSLYGSMCLKV